MQEKDLVKTLDDDLYWRRRHINALFGLCSNKDRDLASAAIRASVTMLYAHWEGYVKKISFDYTDMLSSKRLRYKNLKTCFRGIAAVEYVNLLHDIKKNVFVGSMTIAKIEAIGEDRVKIDLRHRLDNIGNLNFHVFVQLISFIGISPTPYETKRIFIDESLLSRRNRIAHGAYDSLDLSGISDLKDNVLELLEMFRNDIQNAISVKSYLL